MPDHSDFSNLIWQIADLLRGPYRPPQYERVMLPMTVLRRFDCVLAPTKDKVLAAYERRKGGKLEGDALDSILNRAAGQRFHNRSALTFERLKGDPDNIAGHLVGYIQGFSANVRRIFEYFEFETEIDKMRESNLLYLIVSRFCDVDLHPERVPNEQMGLIFENLIRRFNELANETAGDHFTPREVIRLMVNILFIEDDDLLATPGTVRRLLDPACGTGGMLAEAQNYLREHHPQAQLFVYGQDYNERAFATAASDMLMKQVDHNGGGDNIRFGDSFTDDRFADETFDYFLTNPPFGVDWKKQKNEIRDERDKLGFAGRFGAGLPRVNDGSLLVLQHMIAKFEPFRPQEQKYGSRLAIVFSGSPLFTGGAGSGESEIRRWIIENDWLEAIIALPEQMFYNTGIGTYIWIVTILDVLRHYTTYATYYGLLKACEDDPNVERKKAARALARFLRLHPHNIAQKTEVMVEHFQAVTRHKIGGRAKAMVVTGSRLEAVRYKQGFDRCIKEKGYPIKSLVAFSGAVRDDRHPDVEYTEVQMNGGIREKELPEQFATQEYRVLLVAEKYQTGFDQPLLHTLFVDKRLAGIQAVQTLSRLNRTHPLKEDTFVLDFVNDREEIRDAFKVYYEGAAMGDEVEPSRMYEIKAELDASGIYLDEEVDRFCAVYFKPRRRQSAQDHQAMNAVLDAAGARFKNLRDEDEDEAELWRGKVQAFRNLYGFLSQVIPYQDSDLEKLYTYLRHLATKLPRRGSGGAYRFDDEVRLEYYRLQKISEGSIPLGEGDARALDGPTELGSGAVHEEAVPLSQLIDIVNERFGTDFNQADQLFFDQIVEAAVADEALGQAAAANPKDKFELVFGNLLERLIAERMDQNEEIFIRYVNDASFQRLVGSWMATEAYRRLRDRQPPPDSIPAPSLPPGLRLVEGHQEDRYVDCLPLVPLRAAAGAFGDPQHIEDGDFVWVSVDSRRRLSEGMFVAEVVGKSMEPVIPDGAYCLFRAPVTGTRQGKTVLVQLRDPVDPETGQRYTVKRYRSEKAAANDSWRHAKITLEPRNPDFEPIVIEDMDESDIQVIAEFIEILG